MPRLYRKTTQFGRQGYHEKAVPPTTAERLTWALADLEDAVGRLKLARDRHESETLYVAAAIGRYEDVQTLRHTLAQSRQRKAS